MDCAKLVEFKKGNLAPCGQCLSCRINRRRIWAARMVLERYGHHEASFVTLTYRPEALVNSKGQLFRDSQKMVEVPFDQFDGWLPLDSEFAPSVYPPHAQLWLKRLRKALHPRKIRFYLVGEYGERTLRPHYHAALYGMPSCAFGRSRYGFPYYWPSCCSSCDLVRDTWGAGMVHLDELNFVTAGYVAGYITKKMTKKDDPRLWGRRPEFAHMSRRPGIGVHVVESKIAPALIAGGAHFMEETGDVPSSLSIGGKKQPLGRLLKEKLRVQVLRSGFVLSDPSDAPRAQQRQAEMRALQKIAQANTPLTVTLEEAVSRHYKGSRDALEARQKLQRGRTL